MDAETMFVRRKRELTGFADTRFRRIGWTLATGACLIAAAGLSAKAPAPADLHGLLTTKQGVRVLRLWGEPYEQGYAHGYLLADNILGFIEGVLFDPRVMPDPGMYESFVRRGMLLRMSFPPPRREELDGMLAGIRDKVGPEGMMLTRMARSLDVEDLAALNTLADWNPSACSSFAAWGAATTDGGTVVARNLDYFDLPGIRREHLVIAFISDDPDRKSLVSIAWPGLVGVYTAMNEDGLFVATHDAPAPKANRASGLIPRSFVLREILETAPPSSAAAHAANILRASPTFRGNNFLLAAPYDNRSAPAVVFEYDGQTQAESGLSIRTPQSKRNLTPPDTIACTNHYRVRSEPAPCNRYRIIAEALKRQHRAPDRLDLTKTLAIIKAAAVRGTIHTVIALPNKKEFRVHFATPEANATKSEGLRFELASLCRH